MIPERVLAPFTEASFRTGLVIGLVMMAGGVVGAMAWRSRSREPLPAAGLLIAAAGVLVLDQVGRPAPGLGAGVVALGVAGVVVDVIPRARPALPVLALPGAWLLAGGVEVDQAWVPWAVAATVAVGGALVACFDARPVLRRLGPALVVAALAGVFVTVPETKEALPVLGAALPLALLGWPTRLATLGAGGALAATGLLAWTVGQGGTFRDSAIVGGLACLGMLVAEPVGRALRHQRDLYYRPAPLWAVLTVAASHVVVVFLAARVAGLHEDLGSAVVWAAFSLLLGVLASVVVRGVTDRSPTGDASGWSPRRGKPWAAPE